MIITELSYVIALVGNFLEELVNLTRLYLLNLSIVHVQL